MGASYSAPTLKAQLKMGAQRLAMQRNKKLNQLSVDSKAVAVLLQQGKDESARIRCEAILHERNLASAYEMMQLMLELLAARVPLITASKECPADLQEGVASVVYCSRRIEIPELKTIAQQFGAKYGKEWTESHADNESGRVHPRIQEKLAIQAPQFEVLLGMLHEIAATYQIDWKPDLQSLQAGIVNYSNPEQLGSIARIQPAQQAEQPAAQQQASSPVSAAAAPAPMQPVLQPHPQHLPVPSPSNGSGMPVSLSGQFPVANLNSPASSASSGAGEGGVSPYPGTMNLVVHRAKDVLNLASQSEPHDLYVLVRNLATKVSWRSAADPAGGANPLWFGNARLGAEASAAHFPLSVAEGTQQIQFDVMQQNSGAFKMTSDRLLGSAVLYAEQLRANAGAHWYPLLNKNMQTGMLLVASQFLPLNATVLSDAELRRQQGWQELEIEQARRMASAAANASPNEAAMMPMPNVDMLPQAQAQAGGSGLVQYDAPSWPPRNGSNGNGNGGGLSEQYTLSDIVAGRHKEKPASRPGSAGFEPGSEPLQEEAEEHKQVVPGQQPQQQQRGRTLEDEPRPPTYSFNRDEYDAEEYSEFPPVPERAPGAAAASSSHAPHPPGGLQAQRPGAAASSSTAPASASATPAAPAAKKLDPDAEMEERFRRLGGF